MVDEKNKELSEITNGPTSNEQEAENHFNYEKDKENIAAPEEASASSKMAAASSNGPKVFYNSQQARVEKKLQPAELAQLQKEWQHYEVPEEQVSNQLPDYFFAGFWMRLFAFTLDLLCIAAIKNSSLGLVYRLLGLEWQGGFLGVYSLVGIAIYLAYLALLTKYNHGQTIGKMVFGLRVVSLSGEELTWYQVLVREICCRFILMKFPLNLGYLPAAFTAKKQHVGDYFAETSVVTVNIIKAFNKELA